jgi:phage shock protein E
MRLNGIVPMVAAIVLLAACSTAPASTEVQAARLPADIDVATAESQRAQDNVVMLDVRTPEEYAQGHIPGVTLIPLDQLESRLSEVPKDKTLIVTCRSGNRSAQAAELLRQKGYADVHNMLGGFTAWEKAGYPVQK